METSNGNVPEKDSRWRKDGVRHTWTVATVGPKYITLVTNVPWVGPAKVERAAWPNTWRRA